MANSGVATWIAWLMLLLLTLTASDTAPLPLKLDWTSVLKTNAPNMLRLLPPNGGSLMPLSSPPMASFTMLLIGSSTDCVGTFARLGHSPTVWSKNMPVPAFPSRVPAVSLPASEAHVHPPRSLPTASPHGKTAQVWASTFPNLCPIPHPIPSSILQILLSVFSFLLPPPFQPRTATLL